MEKYFLAKVLTDFQSMKDDYETGINLITSLKFWGEQEEMMKKVLDHLMSGLQQQVFVQKYLSMASDKSLKVVTKYLKWLDQDAITCRVNLPEALKRMEYVLDPQTELLFTGLKVPGYEELQLKEFNNINSMLDKCSGGDYYAGGDSEQLKFEGDDDDDDSDHMAGVGGGDNHDNDDGDVKFEDVLESKSELTAFLKAEAAGSGRRDGGAKGGGGAWYDLDMVNPDPEIEIKFEPSTEDKEDDDDDEIEDLGLDNGSHHQSSASGGGGLQCGYCSNFFPTQAKLTIHMRKHTKEKPYKCEVCRKSYSTLGSLNEHKNFHRNEKFYCKVCGKALNSRPQIARHMRAVHNLNVKMGDLKNEKCDLCDKRFFTKEDLEDHRRAHEGGFRCNHCGRSFKSSNFLSRHQTIFPCNLAPRNESNGSGGYDETANNGTIADAAVDKGIRPPIPVRTDDKLMYKCSYCEKMLSSKTKAVEHSLIHTRKKFACRICAKEFATRRKLKVHIKLHSEVVFPCLVCGKTMNSRKLASDHMRDEHSIQC